MDLAGESVLTNCDVKEPASGEDVLKLMECPICQGIPIPPIWNCKNGHIVCSSCRKRMTRCGICRGSFTGGRNLFMEAVLGGCKLSCPFHEKGCKEIMTLDLMKGHAEDCSFGTRIKWVPCNHGVFPENAVTGGYQRGSELLVMRDLFVMRAPHAGSTTPGKFFKFLTPEDHDDVKMEASIAWGGKERLKDYYEVLTAPPECVKWIPSARGKIEPAAVFGGVSESGEPLFIGRFTHDLNLINGKIHPSHQCCYIGYMGGEIAAKTYEILVTVDPTL